MLTVLFSKWAKKLGNFEGPKFTPPQKKKKKNFLHTEIWTKWEILTLFLSADKIRGTV